MVHADGVATDEEVRFMAEVLEDIPFNPDQLAVLKNDIHEPQDIKAMFEGVTDSVDQAEFFKFAHGLVHVDGEFGAEEQEILLQLQEAHVQKVNVDDLIGSVEMTFEADVPEPRIAVKKRGSGGFQGALGRFRKLFK